MNLSWSSFNLPFATKPRSRGDEPAQLLLKLYGEDKTPLTRG